MTYPTYMRRRDAWSLTSGPIDQYLEAKAVAENDLRDKLLGLIASHSSAYSSNLQRIST